MFKQEFSGVSQTHRPRLEFNTTGADLSCFSRRFVTACS